jgi:redox-sensing transcriptional repressor
MRSHQIDGQGKEAEGEPAMVTEQMIERLSLYRHLLAGLPDGGPDRMYSHDLAQLAGTSPAQTRRDLMTIGVSGSPARGYDVALLHRSIAEWLEAPEGQGMALVGLGNLGRAILSYFSGRRAKLQFTAVFDQDPDKVRPVVQGVRCYPAAEITARVRELGIVVAVIAVPATEARKVADQLVAGGVRGIVNYAPTPLVLPPEVYVENRDITIALEKTAYFARKGTRRTA